MHHFQICRFEPDRDAAPRLQTYGLDIDRGDRMLLDVLIKLNATAGPAGDPRSVSPIAGAACRVGSRCFTGAVGSRIGSLCPGGLAKAPRRRHRCDVDATMRRCDAA